MPASADELSDRMGALLTSHERIKAAQSDLEAARAGVEVARGGYYPTASITGNQGNERISTHDTDTVTSYAQREVDLNLTQTLYDFGAIDATVGSAGLRVQQAESALEQTEQAILLAGLSAELNLASAKRVLDFQVQSEESIKRQTELEDARVKRGSGFSTDVLQAKTQLAGAQAARVRAEGALEQAVNRYRAVFGDAPADLSAVGKMNIALTDIPEDVDGVVSAALEKNAQVIGAQLQAEIANTEIDRSFASGYRPVLTASADQKYKRDVGGTQGVKNETLVKVELTYSFNFGFTAANTLKVAQSGHVAANSRLKDARDQIEEQARNAWQNLQTARANADFLENQANIASEFLTLARKERTLGQRSLIDVLAGETSLISAQSAADRARTDVDVAVLTLLNVMGQLDLSVLQ
jgi:adhesin transport system outer membrane protein